MQPSQTFKENETKIILLTTALASVCRCNNLTGSVVAAWEKDEAVPGFCDLARPPGVDSPLVVHGGEHVYVRGGVGQALGGGARA